MVGCLSLWVGPKVWAMKTLLHPVPGLGTVVWMHPQWLAPAPHFLTGPAASPAKAASPVLGSSFS